MLNTSKQKRSRSLDSSHNRHHQKGWIKSFFRGFGSLVRSKNSHKSEKSVYSQTENLTSTKKYDSAIQCSELINCRSDSKSLCDNSNCKQILLNDLSDNNDVDPKPTIVYNKILQDVLSNFPEIERSLIVLTSYIIDEICRNNIHFMTVGIKNLVYQRLGKFKSISKCSTELPWFPHHKLPALHGKEILLDSTHVRNQSMKPWRKAFSSETQKQLKTLRQNVSKRYVIKKSQRKDNQTESIPDVFRVEKEESNEKVCDCENYMYQRSQSFSFFKNGKRSIQKRTEKPTELFCTISVSSVNSCDSVHRIDYYRSKQNLKNSEPNNRVSQGIYFVEEEYSSSQRNELENRLFPRLEEGRKEPIIPSFGQGDNFDTSNHSRNLLKSEKPENRSRSKLEFQVIKDKEHNKESDHENDTLSNQSSIILDVEIQMSSCENIFRAINKSDYTINDVKTLDSHEDGDILTESDRSVSKRISCLFKNQSNQTNTCLEDCEKHSTKEKRVANKVNCNLDNDRQQTLRKFFKNMVNKYASSVYEDDKVFWGYGTEQSLKSCNPNDQAFSITDTAEAPVADLCEVFTESRQEKQSSLTRRSVNIYLPLSEGNYKYKSKRISNQTFLKHTIASQMKVKNKKIHI